MLALEKTTKQHLLLLSSSSSSHLTSKSLSQPSLAEKDGLEEAEVKNVRLDWICKNEGCWCGQSPSQRAGWHFTGVCLKEVTGGADRLKSLNVRLSTRSSPLVLKQHARRQCGSQHSARESAVKSREYNAASDHHRADMSRSRPHEPHPVPDATYFMRTNLQNRTYNPRLNISWSLALRSRVYGFYMLVIRAEIRASAA